MKKWFLILAAQLIAIALCKAQSTSGLSIGECYKLAEHN